MTQKTRSLLVVAALGLAAAACTQNGAPIAPNPSNQTGSMAYPAPNPAGNITTTVTPR